MLTTSDESIFLCAITKYGKVEQKFRVYRRRQRQTDRVQRLWKDTGIGNVLPWEDFADEVERLLEMRRASQDATKEEWRAGI